LPVLAGWKDLAEREDRTASTLRSRRHEPLREVRRFKELRAADAEEITRLKADVEALVGALHQATVENGHLRHQLADRVSVVRALPAQAPFSR
jgi:regulator of replication initiation timing